MTTLENSIKKQLKSKIKQLEIIGYDIPKLFDRASGNGRNYRLYLRNELSLDTLITIDDWFDGFTEAIRYNEIYKKGNWLQWQSMN